MSGNVLERGATGLLILIIPIALALVVLYTAWPLILALVVLGIILKIWQHYQWKKWSQQINPFFNQLIRDNQGCLTPLDLAAKADLTGASAKRFLDKKAEEYGAQRKEFQEKGTVYYFLTASALGTIFDSSEPFADLDEAEDLVQEDLAEEETETPAQTEEKPEHSSPAPEGSLSSLIQADLAKRLNVKDYKISRYKSNDDFSEWSQNLDPDGIAWKYLPEDKLFVPQE
ncbi:MAG: hypothetical protein SW833_02015 [Cyanobacteriota bacterium]|nr:hypothetical protein [Cyanobacteriota bacterium]